MTQCLNQRRNESRLVRWWRNWIGNRSARAEMDRLGSRELGIIAQDVGASKAELRALAGRWPDSADLLARRMAWLRLDPAEIARTDPAVSRDMNKLCSLCGSKRQCEHDLDRATINPSWRRYCPNFQTLAALVAGRRSKPDISAK